jgi:integrase
MTDMATKLTDAKLKALRAPDKGQLEHSDSEVPGLRIRIGTTGAKTFMLRKRVAGRVRNITIGRYSPRFGLADARKKARALISDLESGKALPTPLTRPTGAAGTIRALMPAYLASKSHRRSAGEMKRVMDLYVLPKLGDRFADSVTRGEVTEFIDDIAQAKSAMAIKVHAQLSAFYTWALPRIDKMGSNPCRDAGRPTKAKARDRVLTEAELRALWLVADAETLPWRPALKLLILTGARREEVFNADRAEFDLKAKEWVLPAARAKNGQPHIIPLSNSAFEILKLIAQVDGSTKLFPTRRKATQEEKGPSGFSKAQARFRTSLDQVLERQSGEHWTLHDIRRTVATGLQRLGVRFEVTEAVLNHVSGARGGIAGVYQRHDWKAEKRAALDAWAEELARIVAA